MTTITVLFDPPSRSDPEGWSTAKADQFAEDLVTFCEQMNTIISELAQVSIDAAAAAASASAADLAKLAAQGAANFVGDWSNVVNYTVGQCVLRTTNSNRYVARTNNTNKAPESNAADWLNITSSGTVTSVAAGTGVTVTGTPTVTPTVNIDKATDANIRAATSNKVLTADTFNSSMAPVASSGAGSFTLDFNAARVFHRTLTSNAATTLNNPTNVSAGQGGLIFITNHSTPVASISLGANFKWVGGTPNPSIGGASTRNKYAYFVFDTSNILIEYIGTF